MPAIARLGDPISCGDTLAKGSGDVFANGMPVTRVDPADTTAGHCFNPTFLTSGAATVFANGKPVGIVGSPINVHFCGPASHSGTVANGSPDVFAGP